ncbi:MAG TPA: TIGR00725 family protein [Candidatus Acidoferrales bacterium]|nr:TIGR00725 family protein [Candidatus Acidoferrales bacterium]
MNKMQIGIIGSTECSSQIAKIAERTGFLIARSGSILICGGRTGVMEAASKGAKAAGGITVGVLPGSSKEEANSYTDITIVTEMGHARNAIIARSSDCIIGIAGGYGTLSEIALALKMGKPVITLASQWAIDGTINATSPEDAVECALRLLAIGKKNNI